MTESPLLGDVVKHGSIGPVWCEGRELIRRLFVTVRDEHWQEIAPTEWLSGHDVVSQTVSISARHVSDLVDFAWQGTLKMAAGGRELSFEFTGKVLRKMKVCRLGLVILHPVEWMIGSDIYADSAASLHLPDVIAPQPIVNGLPAALTEPFSSLRVESVGLGKLGFRFEGDLFELEDQRNWGDASFKAYCTPLRLGFPRSVEPGTTLTHRVHLKFEPSATCGPSRNARPNRLSLFPKIGRMWSRDVTALPWSHIQLRIKDDGSLAEFSNSLMMIPPSMRLELAIESPRNPDSLRAILGEYKSRIERLLILGPVTEELRAFDDVPTLVATQGYFVEFNRGVPLAASAAGIAFPLTATVHSDDADTIVGNVAAIRDVANTARRLLHNPSIALAPLALYHPRPQSPRTFPEFLGKPWLVASIIEAALAGVSSITLDDDAVAELSKPALQNKELSLSALVACSDVKVAPVESDLPADVYALLLETTEKGTKRLLASNLSSDTKMLTVSNLEVEIPAYRTRLIDIAI